MYNVNNKFAMKQGGWNTCAADTGLKDHTMREIARPNNDTLYIACMLDLRKEPIILELPAFDSQYVSLMVTAYDHYVNVPLATRRGDFKAPTRMLLYSARTEGYGGQPVEGVDHVFEATGDFISAVLRIMPHASDPERFARIVGEMKAVRLETLAQFQGKPPQPIDRIDFPSVGQRDADVFENNLLDVMQFVMNHTTFDPGNELDRSLLAAYEPLGVVPGRTYDAARVTALDGARVRSAVERIIKAEVARATDANFQDRTLLAMFKPKGQIDLDTLLFQSISGPIGLPLEEAAYPAVPTSDGQPMNALHDYVIRMAAQDLPPADAFWSVTLYDTKNGFFIPNDRKKYSVGANAGMRLNEDGGIEIYIAAERPAGVPLENWLPINRQDQPIDAVLRIYVPDLDRMKTWQPPVAEMIR